MRKLFLIAGVIAILFVFVSVPFLAVSAAAQSAPVVQETPPDIFAVINMIEAFAKTAATLTGFALLWAAVSNAGKFLTPSLFPDGSAPSWNLVFQIVTLITLVGLQLSGNSNLVPLIDAQAGAIANVITSILSLAYMLYGSRLGHENIFAGLPLIGTSYSGRLAGEGALLETIVDQEFQKEEFGEFVK
jgi:hypothetical protein